MRFTNLNSLREFIGGLGILGYQAPFNTINDFVKTITRERQLYSYSVLMSVTENLIVLQFSYKSIIHNLTLRRN